MSNLICKECGGQIPEGAATCPECGSPIEVEMPTAAAGVSRFCTKCGTQLGENQQFCPNCGTKTGTVGKSKKKIIIPAAAAVVLALAAVLIVFLIPPKVESVEVPQNFVELKAEETFQATYTINPEKAAKTKAEWTSNNELVATVDDTGLITAVADGTADITVTAKDKSAVITVTVKTGPDFEAICKKVGGSSMYIVLASDGSYLSVDTNPSDTKYGASNDVLDKVKTINKELGLPDSVYQKMLETNSLDGRVSDTYNGVKVSWKYHPEKGLEVMYEKAE